LKLSDDDLTDLAFNLAFFVMLLALWLFTPPKLFFISIFYAVCLFVLWLWFYSLKLQKELKKTGGE